MQRGSHSRILAAAAGAVLIVALLLSAFLLASEAGHRCEDKDCAVCRSLERCRNVLQRLFAGGTGTAPALYALIAAAAAAVFAFIILPADTPIQRKTRLND